MGFAFKIESLEHLPKANRAVVHGCFIDGQMFVGDHAVLSSDVSKTPLLIQGVVLGAGLSASLTLAARALLKSARKDDILSSMQ